MNTKIKLSTKQQEAVNYENGALLVKASAGSGKTRVLTERIKKLLLKNKKKILAITFTNKAGEEMKERLGDSKEIKSRVFVGTFHSFCQNVLEMRGNLLGFQKMPHIFEKETDRLQLIEEAISLTPTYYSKYAVMNSKDQTNFKYRALQFISKTKRDFLSDEDLLNDKLDEDTVLLYHTYNDLLNSQNAIDFDDLILLTYKLFIDNPSVASLYRRTYNYICIDEAQDLNNAQYQLLKAITNGEFKNLMMVGDPNQAIFAFNGSSSKYMNDFFVEDFSPHPIELKENYRSSVKVIEAAEKIIPNSTEKINAVILGIFEIHPLPEENSEANWILNKIKELVFLKNHNDIEGVISYEKMAILSRNKYIFALIEERLKNENIPYYYKTTPGAIKFESDLMNIFDLALTVKLNPSDSLHLLRLHKILNIKKEKNLTKLVNLISNESFAKTLDFVINLKEDGSNVKRIFRDFSEYVKYANDINNEDKKKRILDEIEEIKSHWSQYSRKTDNPSLSQFKIAMALGQTHPLSIPKGIALSTVHTMKGQEFDIVFLMGMDEGTFPDYRAVRNGGVELKQEKNNAYVAFTRAKRFLYVTYPLQRTMPWGATFNRMKSRFLTAFK